MPNSAPALILGCSTSDTEFRQAPLWPQTPLLTDPLILLIHLSFRLTGTLTPGVLCSLCVYMQNSFLEMCPSLPSWVDMQPWSVISVPCLFPDSLVPLPLVALTGTEPLPNTSTAHHLCACAQAAESCCESQTQAGWVYYKSMAIHRHWALTVLLCGVSLHSPQGLCFSF